MGADHIGTRRGLPVLIGHTRPPAIVVSELRGGAVRIGILCQPVQLACPVRLSGSQVPAKEKTKRGIARPFKNHDRKGGVPSLVAFAEP